MGRGEGLPARRDRSVSEPFEVALEVGQGRSQLVRCVRDEVRPFAGVRVEPLGGGRFTLDFNRAYNPYCAYNDAWRCPLPPSENWLAVAIRAGELSFH